MRAAGRESMVASWPPSFTAHVSLGTRRTDRAVHRRDGVAELQFLNHLPRICSGVETVDSGLGESVFGVR